MGRITDHGLLLLLYTDHRSQKTHLQPFCNCKHGLSMPEKSGLAPSKPGKAMSKQETRSFEIRIGCLTIPRKKTRPLCEFVAKSIEWRERKTVCKDAPRKFHVWVRNPTTTRNRRLFAMRSHLSQRNRNLRRSLAAREREPDGARGNPRDRLRRAQPCHQALRG